MRKMHHALVIAGLSLALPASALGIGGSGQVHSSGFAGLQQSGATGRSLDRGSGSVSADTRLNDSVNTNGNGLHGLDRDKGQARADDRRNDHKNDMGLVQKRGDRMSSADHDRDRRMDHE